MQQMFLLAIDAHYVIADATVSSGIDAAANLIGQACMPEQCIQDSMLSAAYQLEPHLTVI